MTRILAECILLNQKNQAVFMGSVDYQILCKLRDKFGTLTIYQEKYVLWEFEGGRLDLM